MIWQLLQVNHLVDTPLILVGKMWPGLVAWAKQEMLAADPPLASAVDLDLPKCVADGAAAIAVIRKHHTLWKRKMSHANAKPRKKGSKKRLPPA